MNRPRWDIPPEMIAMAQRMAARVTPSARRKQREQYAARMLARAEANRLACRLSVKPVGRQSVAPQIKQP